MRVKVDGNQLKTLGADFRKTGDAARDAGKEALVRELLGDGARWVDRDGKEKPLNRLNVATSRAKCLSIVVSSPQIFEAECRTPRQMQLANAFCRYLELAEEINL